MKPRERIARRAALELIDGAITNLGLGMPLDVLNYLPKGMNVILHSENGALFMGPPPRFGEQNSDLANAGAFPITLLPGASTFDIATSFCIIRGGHIQVSVLGALEVDQTGAIANWGMEVKEGKYTPGIGGAMDLVTGSSNLVVLIEHNSKNGESKIVKKCTMPLTGTGVRLIISEKAVFEVTPKWLLLKEIAPDISVEELRKVTDADFIVTDDDLIEYRLA